MISILIPVRMVVKVDQEKVERIMYSSLTRLIVKARARLVRLDNSHQTIISGRMVCSPRARIMVHV